jgi:hypothetical protein
MTLIYYLFVTFFIGFEIQKLFQVNFFFKVKRLTADYYKQIITKVNTVLYKEIIKISLVDILYTIILFFGLFTINRYFFFGILLLSLIQAIVFKIKNVTFRKISYIIDNILSIILLSLSVINFLYYKVDALQFIKQLINQ